MQLFLTINAQNIFPKSFNVEERRKEEEHIMERKTREITFYLCKKKKRLKET